MRLCKNDYLMALYSTCELFVNWKFKMASIMWLSLTLDLYGISCFHFQSLKRIHLIFISGHIILSNTTEFLKNQNVILFVNINIVLATVSQVSHKRFLWTSGSCCFYESWYNSTCSLVDWIQKVTIQLEFQTIFELIT